MSENKMNFKEYLLKEDYLDAKLMKTLDADWDFKPSQLVCGKIQKINKTKYPRAIAIEFSSPTRAEGEWKIENRFYNQIFSNREPKPGNKISLKIGPDNSILAYEID